MAKELKEEDGKFYLDIELADNANDETIANSDLSDKRSFYKESGYKPILFEDSPINYIIVGLVSFLIPIGSLYWLAVSIRNFIRTEVSMGLLVQFKDGKPMLLVKFKKLVFHKDYDGYNAAYAIEENKVVATFAERLLFVAKGFMALFIAFFTGLVSYSIITSILFIGSVLSDSSSSFEYQNIIPVSDSTFIVSESYLNMYKEPMTESKMTFPVLNTKDTLINLKDKVFNRDSTEIWRKVAKKELNVTYEGWILASYRRPAE